MRLRQAAIGGLQDKTQGKLFEASHNDYVDEECDTGDNNPLSCGRRKLYQHLARSEISQPCSVNSTLILHNIAISIVGT